jgi:hypothetical protein
LRRVEWLFIFLFIFSGLYCLAIVAGVNTFQLPLPHWFQVIGSYISPYKWVLIIIGILVSLWSIWINRNVRNKD